MAVTLAQKKTSRQSQLLPTHIQGCLVWSNPSIERTFQRPLRALWPAAHVKR